MTEPQSASTVQVDPDVLRNFAGQLESEATAITNLGAGDTFAQAAAALPGTEFGTNAQRVADLTRDCLQRIADRHTTVAANLRTDAGAYELTETQFGDTLSKVGSELPA